MMDGEKREEQHAVQNEAAKGDRGRKCTETYERAEQEQRQRCEEVPREDVRDIPCEEIGQEEEKYDNRKCNRTIS